MGVGNLAKAPDDPEGQPWETKIKGPRVRPELEPFKQLIPRNILNLGNRQYSKFMFILYIQNFYVI